MTFDAVLLLGFGGPEHPDEVMPFLERVTAGRGIPRERLAEVGQHYGKLGGVSPINEQNRALRAALEAALRLRQVDLPVVLGNRNTPPFVVDVLRDEVGAGRRRVLALATSAFPSYSGCRQYREDVGLALAAGVDADVVKLPPFDTLPGLFEAWVENTVAGLRAFDGDRPHLLFTTHSIPNTMARTAGPEAGWPSTDGLPGAYVTTQTELARRVVAEAAARLGIEPPDWSLVYQSRSGSPHVPWLEPDVNDALTELAEAGVKDVLVLPVGFLSDHVEVIWDLDNEAAQTAVDLGLRMLRVPTPGVHPAFVDGLADLVAAHLQAPSLRAPRAGESCFDACCPAPRRPGVASGERPVCAGVVIAD